MRNLFFILITICCIPPVSSQTQSNFNKSEKEQVRKAEIFFCRYIEKDAQVNIKHWQAYLDQNLQLDSLAQDTIPEGTYSVTAMFIIGKKACIDEVKILNDPGYGLGEKVSRAILEYEQWIPAERNGRKVRAYRKQVVTIVAKKDECKGSFAEFIL